MSFETSWLPEREKKTSGNWRLHEEGRDHELAKRQGGENAQEKEGELK